MGPSSPPPKKRKAHIPIFGPCLLWPKDWMDQDASLSYEGIDLGPGMLLDGNPAPLEMDCSLHPHFGPSIVAKLLDGSN